MLEIGITFNLKELEKLEYVIHARRQIVAKDVNQDPYIHTYTKRLLFELECLENKITERKRKLEELLRG